MPIEWNNLRPLNGSQQSAFEELCCQLAAYEKSPTGSKFIRKGAPDAGVECYWVLPGGDEWGWQTKYFTSSPDDGQWHQVDGSVKTTLAKHPRITSYTICFPIDRQDPRIEKRKLFTQNTKSLFQVEFVESLGTTQGDMGFSHRRLRERTLR